ncbi:MAG: hypothetical protein WA956_02005 [Stenotrophomonas sp.]
MTESVDMPMPVMREQFITRPNELQLLIDAMAGYGDVAQSAEQDVLGTAPVFFGAGDVPNQPLHLHLRHNGLSAHPMM